jgi:hypothetical protein
MKKCEEYMAIVIFLSLREPSFVFLVFSRLKHILPCLIFIKISFQITCIEIGKTAKLSHLVISYFISFAYWVGLMISKIQKFNVPLNKRNMLDQFLNHPEYIFHLHVHFVSEWIFNFLMLNPIAQSVF